MRDTSTGDNIRAHSVLSPSSCSRWVNCPPSAILNYHAERTTSAYAEEGTLAHAYAEEMLMSSLLLGGGNSTVQRMIPERLGVPADMSAYVQTYIDYVQDLAHRPACKRLCSIESRVDLSFLAPDTFGTVDFYCTLDNALHIADLKYGQGVRVDAKDNYQLMLYAYGITVDLSKNNSLTVDRIVLHIVQPRLDHISVHELPFDALNNWFFGVVYPAARQAMVGEGDKKAGEHCKFCAVRARCRTAADHAQAEILSLFEVKKPEDLTNDELAQAIRKYDDLTEWIKSVKSEAFATLMRGEQIPGYMLTNSVGNRRWSDEATALKALARKLGKKNVTATALLSVAQLEKKLGKPEFAELCGSLVTRPDNGPVLTKFDAKKVGYRPKSPEELFGDI